MVGGWSRGVDGSSDDDGPGLYKVEFSGTEWEAEEESGYTVGGSINSRTCPFVSH